VYTPRWRFRVTLWYGILIGLSGGFVRWKVPVLVRTRHVRKLRQIVMEIKRIRGQYAAAHRVPNSIRPGWRERSIDRALIWWEFTKPRVVDHIRR
jgi:hypothetical protein